MNRNETMNDEDKTADDVREALVSELRLWAALIGAEPRGARDLFTRAADALAEVRPRGAVTDAAWAVGAPDATNNVGDWCRECDGIYCCTRQPGHEGPHASGDGEVIAHAWGRVPVTYAEALAAAWDEGFSIATRNSPNRPHPMAEMNPYRNGEVRTGGTFTDAIDDEVRALRQFAAELTPPASAALFRWAAPARAWMLQKADLLEAAREAHA